jgi:hypothetical protein
MFQSDLTTLNSSQKHLKPADDHCLVNPSTPMTTIQLNSRQIKSDQIKSKIISICTLSKLAAAPHMIRTL